MVSVVHVNRPKKSWGTNFLSERVDVIPYENGEARKSHILSSKLVHRIKQHEFKKTVHTFVRSLRQGDQYHVGQNHQARGKLTSATHRR